MTQHTDFEKTLDTELAYMVGVLASLGMPVEQIKHLEE